MQIWAFGKEVRLLACL